jgi:putative endonuclease
VGGVAERGWIDGVIPAQAGIRQRKFISMRQEKTFYVYILAIARNSTFYVGVTSDLIKRIWQHKNELADGFTKKYDIKTLVYYEEHTTAEQAFIREKQLKKWNRPWKMRIIEEINPN